MHFRHIHDFWNCFLKGIKSKKINYNLRQRNQVFENDKNKMKTAFNLIIDHFNNIKFDDLIIEDDLIAPNNNISINSNTNRELIFLYEHTIHHIYIIRMVMNSLNIKIKNELIGYNLSTIKNIKCGVMNTFIYLTEKRQEELGEFFLIIKMIILKMTLSL